jgi:hypothetical protein
MERTSLNVSPTIGILSLRAYHLAIPLRYPIKITRATWSRKDRYGYTASEPHSCPHDKKNEAYYLVIRGLRDGVHAPAAPNTRRAYINRDQGHRKRPNQQHVPPYRSRKSTYSGAARRTCRRCTRTHTAKKCNCELPPRTIILSALLNVLQISWGSCESFGADPTDPNLQCGSLDVPMDYHDSSAGTARLAVIKYAATAPKKGTIFFNPGEPSHPSFVPPLILRFHRRARRFGNRVHFNVRFRSGTQSKLSGCL